MSVAVMREDDPNSDRALRCAGLEAAIIAMTPSTNPTVVHGWPVRSIRADTTKIITAATTVEYVRYSGTVPESLSMAAPIRMTMPDKTSNNAKILRVKIDRPFPYPIDLFNKN